jgi:pimeloyl-ACP methyl ester carboxylesterase
MEGVAQFCDACKAREHAPIEEPTFEAVPPASVAKEPAPTGHKIDVVFFAIAGCIVLGAVVWLLALGGAQSIGLGSDDSAPQTVLNTATPSPVPSLAPLGFENTACTFEMPGEEEAECGYLTVHQSRAQPDRGRVRLPVALFKSTSAERRPDPVIYLDGGPGSDTLEGVPLLYEALKPLAANRDLILFDQRGAGASEPSLDCPEVTDVNYNHILRQFTIEERVAQDAASAKGCYDRLLRGGIDPAFATSAESAADVNDLRLALGYDQLNLYGVSYGTKLALTIMRDFPEGVRSAILDSVYPPQSDLYAEFQADFDRALDVLFEACAADSFCSEAYPELGQAFYDTVDRLNEIPVQVSLGAVTGRSGGAATIDGIWFSAFIFQSLYSKEFIPLLPRMIFDTRDHEYDLIEILADVYFQDVESISPGMYLSVQCGEETPFVNRDSVIAAAEAHPRLRGFSEYSAKSIFAACDEWQAPPAAASANDAVRSAIPALVLTGQFDPITPPAWGRLAAESLENSFFFEFPGVGHGVALSNECPAGIALAFLDDPGQEPARGCVDTMGAPNWAAY